MSEKVIEHNEPIHEWFGLSYAHYLVLPRSILQSAPEVWQERFVQCLKELHIMFGDVPLNGTYEVHLRGENGQYVKDDLSDYERGRRRVQMNRTVVGLATFIQNLRPGKISRFHARGRI